MSRVLRHGLAFLLLFGSGLAAANFHTFVVDQVYSNASGSIQFVVLREAQGAGGQHFLAGHALTASGGGTTRTFTFPGDTEPGRGIRHRARRGNGPAGRG